MKISIVSALYPSNSIGGAEDCAQGFAQWAQGDGHDVQVIAVKNELPASFDFNRDIAIHEIESPLFISVTKVRRYPKWIKPFWHLQDHLGTAARRQVLPILDSFKPDIVVVHYIQGLGYRLIRDIASAGYPVVYVMHDLALACYRMMMFKDGHPCKKQCLACRASSAIKKQVFLDARDLSNVGLISPSKANLDLVGRYFPIDEFSSAVILNTKTYPTSLIDTATCLRTLKSGIRLVFVGKLEPSKGIEVLLEGVERARAVHGDKISINVCGGGILEAKLRAKYLGSEWCNFHGFVDQQRIANELALADVACAPSIMHENSPGSVIQALVSGTPVFASKSGGIAELIEHNVTGYFVDPKVEDWEIALGKVLEGEIDIYKMKQSLSVRQYQFTADTIGRKTLQFFEEIIRGAS